MAAQREPNNALQIIFSFFLGLMVLAFIGIGVNTFYPSPSARFQDELQDLYRQQEQYNLKTPQTLTPAEQVKQKELQDKITALQEQQQDQERPWARNTSIVLILFATLVMSISLIRSEQLRVISNGLLLGGLFTMVYGVGWVIFAGESTARFIVIVFAFGVTIALGYLKFVRGRQVATLVGAEGGAAAEAVAYVAADPESALDSRVAALEAKLNALAAALTGERPDR